MAVKKKHVLGGGFTQVQGQAQIMTNKIRARKAKRKLLLQWAEPMEFVVPVTVHPCTEPRLLKDFTIAIQLRKPAQETSFWCRVES